MSTPSGFNAEKALWDAVPTSLNLDANARNRLAALISEGAPALQSAPQKLAEAQASMRRLAEYLQQNVGFTAPSITETHLALALASLCPLFPICRRSRGDGTR